MKAFTRNSTKKDGTKECAKEPIHGNLIHESSRGMETDSDAFSESSTVSKYMNGTGEFIKISGRFDKSDVESTSEPHRKMKSGVE